MKGGGKGNKREEVEEDNYAFSVHSAKILDPSRQWGCIMDLAARDVCSLTMYVLLPFRQAVESQIQARGTYRSRGPRCFILESNHWRSHGGGVLGVRTPLFENMGLVIRPKLHGNRLGWGGRRIENVIEYRL